MTQADETAFSGIPEGLTVRRAVNADAEPVKALVWTTLREYGMEPDPAHADRGLDHIETAFDGGGLWLVEDGEGHVVGTVGLIAKSETVCELTKMFLVPAMRGRGLGRALLSGVLDIARRRGFNEMTLETDTSLTLALRLYEAAGFDYVNEDNGVSRCNRVMRLKLW